MKRISRIVAILAIMIFACTGLCFAEGTEGGLNLLDTYPKEGSTGAAIENFDVKLYFDNEMSEEVLGSKNDSCFTLIDANGNILPILVLYSPKETGVVMVLFDTNKENLDSDGKKITIQGDMEYTLKISGDLVDDEGNTLGEDKTVAFSTINQRRNSMVSMLLMFVLYAGIIGFSIRSSKKNNEKENESKDAKFNPYKEAKRTGKSVEEVMAKEQKRQERKARKQDDDEDEDEDDNEDEIPELPDGYYRVKTKRTVASAGSTYITGRKAEAEERREREARYARNQSKNKKKGKGKKK